MTTTIKEHLKTLEQDKKLKILMAVESGSRAWGFPSPDSDYDVRIIYVREKNWYLSINEKKDTIDYFHGALLDINGWDIRKALSLLMKSNVTPFEWAQSPIVYFEEAGFREKLLELAAQFFQPYHSINHYRGIARNSYFKHAGAENIKLKKLFYVIRPVFAINWILKKSTIPPMDIFGLMEVIEDEVVKNKILELIKIKETVNEDFVYTIDPVIKKYLDDEFQKLEHLGYLQKRDVPDIEVLNLFYRSILEQYAA